MSILSTPSPRSRSAIYLENEVVPAGFENAAAVVVPVRGSQVSIALRTEAAANLTVYVEDYSAPGGYRVGPTTELFTVTDDIVGVGRYATASPAVRIVVYNASGEPDATIRGVIVTDHPVASTTEDTLRAISGSISAGLVTEGRVGGNLYTSTNLLAGTAPEDYDIRDTDTHSFKFRVVGDAIFDSSIWLYSSLDQPLRIWLTPMFEHSAGGAEALGPTFFQGVDALTLPAAGRVCICPEVPRDFSLSEGNRLVFGSTIIMAEMPLLREPVADAWLLRLYAEDTAPTSGSVVIRHLWRK